MIITRYAICSERGGKPVTRLVCENRAEAEASMAQLRSSEQGDSEEAYWIAELGPECEGWRYLAAPQKKRS